ncbi:hypothetical protein QWY93_18130 [Echinicola jeungdonensis]|uniref:hypothetical protein n=1 Tax=Echinicola jeungdonensis TaxID=709343 RepID=UPI0025B32A81|nr:hypothetical protein [Echinicola jeungdonensis]MDN3671225.1 hypothetical protein [Echinicola jeungdonensis]
MENNFITIKKGIGINPLGLFPSEENQRYASPCHQLSINAKGDWAGNIEPELWKRVDQYIQGEGHKAERFPSEARLLSYLIQKMDLKAHPHQMINAATSRGSIDYLVQTQRKHSKLPVWTSPHSTLGLRVVGRDYFIAPNPHCFFSLPLAAVLDLHFKMLLPGLIVEWLKILSQQR